MKIIFLILSLLLSLSALAEFNTNIDKAVFGTYQRQQVTDASKPPFSYVGRIGLGCTATLIGSKYIITAAHCVYSNGAWETGLFFYPRVTDNGVDPFGKIAWTRIFVQKEFLESLSLDHDFAVLELAQPIGDKLGWANLGIVDSSFNKNIRITGYPQDEILSTMWTVTCPSNIVGSLIKYRCDTYNGMSGSSIFSSKDKSSEALVYGVHSWADQDANGGVIINQRNFEVIMGWMANKLSSNTVVRTLSK